MSFNDDDTLAPKEEEDELVELADDALEEDDAVTDELGLGTIDDELTDSLLEEEEDEDLGY